MIICLNIWWYVFGINVIEYNNKINVNLRYFIVFNFLFGKLNL